MDRSRNNWVNQPTINSTAQLCQWPFWLDMFLGGIILSPLTMPVCTSLPNAFVHDSGRVCFISTLQNAAVSRKASGRINLYLRPLSQCISSTLNRELPFDFTIYICFTFFCFFTLLHLLTMVWFGFVLSIQQQTFTLHVLVVCL